jgi:hypothetical protein
MFAMWEFWKNGISPREFKATQVNDIKTILEIDQAVIEGQKRFESVQATMAGMKARNKW